MSKRLRKILVVPDCHWPVCHVPSWNCMMRAARLFKPDEVLVLGDFANADALSKHTRTSKPDYTTIKEEVPPVRAALRELESLKAKHYQYVMGNHEWRLERYVADQAPALEGTTSWDALLDLSKWDITPYKRTYHLGKINVTHDTGKAGQNAHRASMLDYMGSVFIGHTHFLSLEARGRIGRAPVLAAHFGWLGDPDAVDYTHESNAHKWVLGFGLAWHDTITGVVHAQPVPIINGKACVLGKLV